jgi:uncharacterized protein (TIGR00251 family)
MVTAKSDCRTTPLPVWARSTYGQIVLQLHIQPGARRSQIVGVHGQRLKIALQAPPVDGKANDALIRFLSDTLDIGRSRITLISGDTSREKNVAIQLNLLDATDVVERLLPSGPTLNP